MTTNQGGTLVINPDGTYVYTPATDFTGEDSIMLEVCDENGNCVNSELVIEVSDSTTNPQNTPPIASDDNFSVFVDQPLSSALMGNDSDPDGDVITTLDPATGVAAATSFTLTTAQGGTVVVAPDGTFTYTSAAGFIGIDTFCLLYTSPSPRDS